MYNMLFNIYDKNEINNFINNYKQEIHNDINYDNNDKQEIHNDINYDNNDIK